jgi:hypothetical protein
VYQFALWTGLILVIALPVVVVHAVTTPRPKPPPHCYWHELEQGGRGEHRWVLVCDGPPRPQK